MNECPVHESSLLDVRCSVPNAVNAPKSMGPPGFAVDCDP